mmetsp:Transcript_29091/g.49603  ORF Transcript_29091/g.49603 Transcript_29091/m.49603 type:complete len:376 (+) Transcript_29091:667-1794(+)
MNCCSVTAWEAYSSGFHGTTARNSLRSAMRSDRDGQPITKGFTVLSVLGKRGLLHSSTLTMNSRQSMLPCLKMSKPSKAQSKCSLFRRVHASGMCSLPWVVAAICKKSRVKLSRDTHPSGEICRNLLTSCIDCCFVSQLTTSSVLSAVRPSGLDVFTGVSGSNSSISSSTMNSVPSSRNSKGSGFSSSMLSRMVCSRAAVDCISSLYRWISHSPIFWYTTSALLATSAVRPSHLFLRCCSRPMQRSASSSITYFIFKGVGRCGFSSSWVLPFGGFFLFLSSSSSPAAPSHGVPTILTAVSYAECSRSSSSSPWSGVAVPFFLSPGLPALSFLSSFLSALPLGALPLAPASTASTLRVMSVSNGTLSSELSMPQTA